MDALVMCGGRGTRLAVDTEKPLLSVGGRPMVDRVLDALEASDANRLYAAVSPHTPETAAHLEGRAVEVLETSGAGYVEDLDTALEGVDEPVLTVASDLPLLEAELVDDLLASHDSGAESVCVPRALKRLLGLGADRTLEHCGRSVTPTGLNVVDAGDDAYRISHDVRLAVNVNTVGDREVAEALA